MILRNITKKWTQTVGPENEIDEIVKPVLALQKLCGLQILDPSWKWKPNGWKIIIIISLSVYMTVGSVAVIADGSVDSDIKNESLYIIILSFVDATKALLFVNNKDLFQMLYLTATTTLYSFVKSSSKTRAERLQKSLKILMYCVLGLTLIPTLQYQVTVFWNYRNGEKMLLTRSTYVLMPSKKPYYEIGLFIQNIFVLETACIVMLLDVWFAFFTLILSAACDTLCELLVVQPPKEIENNPEYAHRLNTSLKCFYEAHLKVIEYLEKLCKAYKWLALVPLTNVAMCLCVVLLVLRKELNWSFISHILPLLGQVFCYSWFGEKILSKVKPLMKE